MRVTGTQLLRTAILERARVEGTLLRVDDFLNHRVDPDLIAAVGADLAARFAAAAPQVVLTAEASGIPPALTCALSLGVPMVFAKKYLGPGGSDVVAREVYSPTRGMEYRVEVSRRALFPGERLVVVDDFLAGGRTAEALGEIAEEAGCTVAGFGFAIEKTFQEGRGRLLAHGWRVEALAPVVSLEGGRVVLGG
ncbi:MAG: phosphoribosyltransferase family protein [Actinomycetota bacterium]